MDRRAITTIIKNYNRAVSAKADLLHLGLNDTDDKVVILEKRIIYNLKEMKLELDKLFQTEEVKENAKAVE